MTLMTSAKNGKAMRKQKEGFGFGPVVAAQHTLRACRIAASRGDFRPREALESVETDQNPKQYKIKRKHACTRATRTYVLYILTPQISAALGI